MADNRTSFAGVLGGALIAFFGSVWIVVVVVEIFRLVTQHSFDEEALLGCLFLIPGIGGVTTGYYLFRGLDQKAAFAAKVTGGISVGGFAMLFLWSLVTVNYR